MFLTAGPVNATQGETSVTNTLLLTARAAATEVHQSDSLQHFQIRERHARAAHPATSQLTELRVNTVTDCGRTQCGGQACLRLRAHTCGMWGCAVAAGRATSYLGGVNSSRSSRRPQEVVVCPRAAVRRGLLQIPRAVTSNRCQNPKPQSVRPSTFGWDDEGRGKNRFTSNRIDWRGREGEEGSAGMKMQPDAALSLSLSLGQID